MYQVYRWFEDRSFLSTDQILEKHLTQEENHVVHLTLQLLQVLLLCEKLFSTSTGEFCLDVICQIKKLIMYVKKVLDSDWLKSRAEQFSVTPVQEVYNSLVRINSKLNSKPYMYDYLYKN